MEGRVLLTGLVGEQETRIEAVRLVWEVEGVKEVINDDYRFRTVIEQIVLSPSFYKKEQSWFNKIVGR